MNRKNPAEAKGAAWPADLFAVPPRMDPPVPEDAGMPSEDPFGAEFLAEREQEMRDFLATLKPLELDVEELKPLTLTDGELELLPAEPLDLPPVDPEPLRLVRESLDRLAEAQDPDAPGDVEDKE